MNHFKTSRQRFSGSVSSAGAVNREGSEIQ